MKYFKDANGRFFIYEDDADSSFYADKTPATKEEHEAAVAAANAAAIAAEPYTVKRAREYPRIGDQLDALFHAGVFPPEMAAAIAAVKEKYPKN